MSAYPDDVPDDVPDYAPDETTEHCPSDDLALDPADSGNYDALPESASDPVTGTTYGELS